MMKSLSLFRRDSDLERYHLRALTGHHTLSSGTEEKEESLLRKISTGPEEAVWFFAMKRGSGRRRTPRGSNLMWPSVTLRARSELRLWPKATATKKTVLTVKR